MPGLFDGCKFFFRGNFDYAVPSKDDLTSIITAGGGSILSREPKPGHLEEGILTVPFHADPRGELAHCCVYVVHTGSTGNSTGVGGTCGDAVSNNKIRTKYMCSVTSNWLMDCASNFRFMPLPS